MARGIAALIFVLALGGAPASVDQDLQAWNRRNEAANSALGELEEARQDWIANCPKPPSKASAL